MENKNTVLYSSLGVAIFIIIVVMMFWMVKKDKSTAPVDNSNQNVDQTALTPTEDTSIGSVHTAKNAPSISYEEALVKYKDTRIQFDSLCRAIPNAVTYKNNISIMLDNRAPVARVVKIDSAYTVKAYGFKIIKLSSTALPITWLVDCNKSENVATILLQK
ncbi:MAG: hypothetical protein WC822_02900 [Candidatus Paceibacterota bacterium]|jgi:hypothetical protein